MQAEYIFLAEVSGNGSFIVHLSSKIAAYYKKIFKFVIINAIVN